jgi:hypothetical protein
MQRRSYLTLAASALSMAAAGCTSAGDTGDANTTTQGTTRTTTTTSDTTTTSTTQTASVSFSDLTVQSAALQLNTDYLTVHDSGQYVFAQATVEDGSVNYESYTLRFAGETHSPLDDRHRRQLWRTYDEGEYSSHSGGLLVFQLPASADAEAPEAVLEYPGGEHRLAETLRQRLAASPTLSYDLSVPETVAADGSLDVELSVTNESDTPARFVGALNRSGPLVAMRPAETIRPLVPANESKTVTVEQTEAVSDTPSEDVGDGETDIKFYLNTVAGTEERTVRVVES